MSNRLSYRCWFPNEETKGQNMSADDAVDAAEGFAECSMRLYEDGDTTVVYVRLAGQSVTATPTQKFRVRMRRVTKYIAEELP